MKWQECARLREVAGIRDRFTWPAAHDFNCEPGFTVSDLTGALRWITSWPGDWLLSREPIRAFLELEGPSVTGHWLSSVVGMLGALVLMGVLGAVGDSLSASRLASRRKPSDPGE